MSRLIPACQGHEEKSPTREGPGKKRREALREVGVEEVGVEKRVPTPRRLACACPGGDRRVAGRQGIEGAGARPAIDWRSDHNHSLTGCPHGNQHWTEAHRGFTLGHRNPRSSKSRRVSSALLSGPWRATSALNRASISGQSQASRRRRSQVMRPLSPPLRAGDRRWGWIREQQVSTHHQPRLVHRQPPSDSNAVEVCQLPSICGSATTPSRAVF